MATKLPPLNTLDAFAAAARLKSFTKAAQELCVTPSAIGHRIRLLERHYGTRFFLREKNNLILTEKGKVFLHAVLRALSIMQVSASRLFQRNGSRIRLNVAHSFASNWLVERLDDFHHAYSDINVEMRTFQGSGVDRLAKLRSGEVDLAIRYGNASDYRGFERIKLLSVDLFPVCSPDYLAKIAKITYPKDLLRNTLLETSLEPWQPWFHAAGLRRATTSRGPILGDVSLLLTAAISGQGIALVRSCLVNRHLTSGRLVRLLDLSVPSKKAYFAMYLPHAPISSEIDRFLKWLVSECRASSIT